MGSSRGQALAERGIEILDQPISLLRLSTRASKCMLRLGIWTLADLVRHSADDFLDVKNFGLISLREVEAKLSRYGLALRSSTGNH